MSRQFHIITMYVCANFVMSWQCVRPCFKSYSHTGHGFIEPCNVDMVVAMSMAALQA